MRALSPALDTAIAQKYAINSLEQKVQNKVALQAELGWLEEPKRPMICIPTGVSERLGGDLLKEVMPGLLSLPIEIVVLGKGSAEFGSYLTDLAKQHSHRLAIVPNDETAIRKMFAASDMALFLVNPDGLPEIDTCLRYGVVPVAMKGSKLSNYDQNQESGEAFIFEKENVWGCFAAVVRALETYRFPFDWRTIQKHCMEMAE